MRRATPKVVADGTMLDYHQMTTQALEHEIRTALPVGSSLDAVDEFLEKRGIDHSYEKSSRTVYAIARKLKGSTTLASESLSLKFRFDDDSRLKSIDSKVLYTGT
jgi:hypothetical protein